MTTPKKRGRPRKPENWTAEALAAKAEEYFAICNRRRREVVVKSKVVTISDPRPYSIEGFCCHIGILRKKFDAWRKLTNSLGDAANMIHQEITADRIDGALSGRQNGSFAQFMLKNNASEHYRDKVEVASSVPEEVASALNEWSKLWQTR